jgi:cytochrome c biogenesis protein CcmG, thiol:disulfide interchange protein DsbE
MRRVLLPTALLVFSAFPLSLRAEPPPIGKPAPQFALRDRDGALVSLADLAYPAPEKRGRPRAVVALDFFRTDCKPCKKALPKLVELHKKFAGKQLKVLLVALLEEEEGEDKLDKFLKENPLPFLVLVDPYGAAAKKYVAGKGGFQIPAIFVVDKDGVLRHRLQGGDAEALTKLHHQIEELLK